ncbi:MAG TPA: hypothetical protein VEF72_25250 [Mycobacterium sp.]|nr:hypothetical protein [Mycobacterium sp.]
MKPLSESLTDLAALVKRVEESAAAVRAKHRAALQAFVRAELARAEALSWPRGGEQT